jgi:hypothetical protein
MDHDAAVTVTAVHSMSDKDKWPDPPPAEAGPLPAARGDGPPDQRDLVDYLEAVADRIVRVLSGRPLSVIRVRAGQRPFMQKNVPGYAPPWIKTVSMWAESSHREVRYALCEDRPTLIWLANQRAVEYHVMLGTAGHLDRPSCLVLDIDPLAISRWAAAAGGGCWRARFRTGRCSSRVRARACGRPRVAPVRGTGRRPRRR